MQSKNILFLGGLGAPAFVYKPWLKVFQWVGYDNHVVPNSFLTMDTVSTFAKNLIKTASGFDSFDVIGVSYGGNAALYAAYLSPELCEKTNKMVLVCAPALGAPGLLDPILSILPKGMTATLREMSPKSHVVRSTRELSMRKELPFELHCIYHERDLMAPQEKATLPEVGQSHKLDFQWKCVPSALIHEVACINPKTLQILVQILTSKGPGV